MFTLRKRFENPLEQYWRILVKRRATPIVCFILTVGATLMYNESLTPMYSSQAKLLIEDSKKWLNVKDANSLSVDWYITQFEILKSQPIISKVVSRLDLTRNYTGAPSRWDTLKAKLLREPLATPKSEHTAGQLVGLLQNSVSIRPQTSTGLVRISVSSSSAELARDITDALVDTYIEENLQEQIRLSMRGTEYLTERLRKISDRIQETERALESFETEQGIDSMPTMLPAEQLAEFVKKYTDTQSLRWETEERLRVLEQVVKERDFSGITSPNLDDTEIAPQSKALFEAKLELDKLRRAGYLEKHPQRVAAQEQIDTLRKRLVFESRNLIAGLRTELAAQERRERSLYDMIQQTTPGAQLARRKRAEYEFLKREIEIQKGFYARYNEQLKRLQLIDDVQSVTVRIVEKANLPARPYSPNKRLNVGVGIFVGILLGLFLAFFREYLDDTFKTAEDVQTYLEQPVIGTIPTILETRENGALVGPSASIVTEAYRSLRTNLRFFETEREMRTLLVTSSGPSEGKSTTAANVALTLVQMGKRVCLVDTDMRKPALHKLFRQSNRYGISSLFAGVTDKKKLIVPTGHDKLYLLACGPVPPNPAELLASQRMEEAVRNLKEDFDYVIFDSPPALAVTDALVLSSMVDGVLMVIRAGHTQIGVCQKTLDSLLSIKANVIGVVLNRINPKQFGYYPYYQRYYGKTGEPSRAPNEKKALVGKKN